MPVIFRMYSLDAMHSNSFTEAGKQAVLRAVQAHAHDFPPKFIRRLCTQILLRRLENKLFYGPSKSMPMKLARELDEANNDAADTGDSAMSAIDRLAYVQECLKAGPAVPETWDENQSESDSQARCLLLPFLTHPPPVPPFFLSCQIENEEKIEVASLN